MGGQAKQQPPAELPPPPAPVIKYDPTALAAERALVGAPKQSFATSVDAEEEERKRAQLGKVEVEGSNAPKPRRRTERNPGSMVPTAGMNQSAVLTG